MKTKALFLTALTSFALVSCTESEFLGESTEPVVETTNGAIVFGGSAPAMTRADFYGADAAAKLGNKFVLYGTKHFSAEDKTAANDAVVYNNFQVKWQASTAGTTASNTSDWEYVGLQSYDATPTAQGIKYWDYSADYGYTFYAFSSPDISYPANASDEVLVSKVTTDGSSLYNKGYSLTVKTGATLGDIYFADRKPVAKADYDKTVNLTFRNIGTKVRVGFYETIPGYKVQIDKFYIDDDAAAVVTDFAAMKDPKTDGFYASLQNVKASANQTLNVTYYDNSDPTIENRPQMTNPSAGYDYTLKLGNGVLGTDLGTSANSPTWDKTGGAYTTVFPFEGNTNPLLVKLDFTMTAEDGSPDVIKVRGARAIVPAMNVQWKSNFAYTYIFKISDKTNGTTGDVDANDDPTSDPEGLKPITFDAIVVDVTEEKQQTITSVSTNSITTFAEGALVNEYNVGKPIYVVTTDNSSHNVITPSAIGAGAGQARVFKLDKATTEASVLAKLTGSPIDITLSPLVPPATKETTIPLLDGTTKTVPNVKFTPSTAGYYAFVYTTKAYIAPTYTVQTSGTYDSSKTYYMKSGSGAYYAVTVSNATAFNTYKSQLYLKTAAGTAGVYDVKVIKVQ